MGYCGNSCSAGAAKHASLQRAPRRRRRLPAVVEASLPERPVRRRGRYRTRQVDRSCGIIEVEIDGITVRVSRGAEAKTVAAVLRALKAGA